MTSSASSKCCNSPTPTGRVTTPDRSSSYVPWCIHNICNHQAVEVTQFVRALEERIDRKEILEIASLHPGDVEATYADGTGLAEAVGLRPSTPL